MLGPALMMRILVPLILIVIVMVGALLAVPKNFLGQTIALDARTSLEQLIQPFFKSESSQVTEAGQSEANLLTNQGQKLSTQITNQASFRLSSSLVTTKNWLINLINGVGK